MHPNPTPSSAQPTSHGYRKFRSLIVLGAYTLATSLYLIALRIPRDNQTIVSLLCFLGWLLPDVMVIKLLGHPHPGIERFLLNFVGPISSASLLQLLLRSDRSNWTR